MKLKERIAPVVGKLHRKGAGSKLATYLIDNNNQIVGVVTHILGAKHTAEIIYGISKVLENDEWVSVVHSFSPGRDYSSMADEQRARERQLHGSLYIITPRLIFSADRL